MIKAIQWSSCRRGSGSGLGFTRLQFSPPSLQTGFSLWVVALHLPLAPPPPSCSSCPTLPHSLTCTNFSWPAGPGSCSSLGSTAFPAGTGPWIELLPVSPAAGRWWPQAAGQTPQQLQSPAPGMLWPGSCRRCQGGCGEKGEEVRAPVTARSVLHRTGVCGRGV